MGSVDFSSQVTGGTGNYAYNWDFDGTGNSAVAHPRHVYSITNPAVYYYDLVVTDTVTNCAVWISDSVGQCANFVIGLQHQTQANNSVDFSSQITGGSGQYAYQWQFAYPNAAPASTAANPNHTFANSGQQAVALTVTDTFWGCSAIVQEPVYWTSCPQNSLTLRLQYDNFAQENAWDVRDANGTVVAQGTGNSFQSGTVVLEELCLPTGCYTLSIYDSWGDGMCCQHGAGAYQLLDSTGSALVQGGIFGSVERTNFCVGGAVDPCDDFSNTTLTDTSIGNGQVYLSLQNRGSVPPQNVSWNINGTVIPTTAPQLPFIFGNGVHAVCATATDATGTCSITLCDSIVVTNGGNTPNCSGIVPSLNIVQDANDAYQLYLQPVLNSVPTNTTFQFYWTFGDNSSSAINQGNSAHRYLQYGSYEICYVGVSNTGCTVSYCDTITLDSVGNFSRFVYKPGFDANLQMPILNHNISTSKVERKAWQVTLFPNPVRERLYVRLQTPQAVAAQLRVVAPTGQCLQVQTLELDAGKQLLELAVEQLPAGVYFVEIEDAAGQPQRLKFIKK